LVGAAIGANPKDLQKKDEFIKITKAGFYENMVHNVDQIKLLILSLE
jgi:hypothetical protein